MKTRLFFLAAAPLLAVGAAIASAPGAAPAAPGPPAGLLAMMQQFGDAIQQEDVAKAASFLAKNARFFHNADPMLSGRDSLATYWLKNSFTYTSNLKLRPAGVGGDATTGYSITYHTIDIDPIKEFPKGATISGSVMVQYRKEGNAWQVACVHIAEEPPKVKL